MSIHDDILALGKRLGRSIIGQEAMIKRRLGLLANRHLLLKGGSGESKYDSFALSLPGQAHWLRRRR